MSQLSPRRLTAGGAAVAALVAIVAGGAVGVIVRGSSPDAPARTVTTTTAASAPATAVGDLRIALPSDWTRAPKPLAVPGLDVPDALAVDSNEGSAVLAQIDASDRSLLPAALVAALGTDASDVVASGTPLLIGGVRVMSYTVAVPTLLRVYALPTTRGVAVLACTNDFASCPDVFIGLRVDGGTVLPPGPDAALRSRLTEVVTDLSAVRRTQRERLRAATTPQERAAAAAALSAAYQGAADTLAPLATLGAQSQATVRSLRDIRRDYEALGAAATAQDVAAFERAGRSVADHEAELDRVLARWNVAA